MVAQTREAARLRTLRSCVLTFEPHPRELFAAAGAPTRLTSLREKLELLRALDVEIVYVAKFNRAFAAQSAEDFVGGLLADTLQTRWLMVGRDFRFGARRSGDTGTLASLAARFGIELEIMQDVTEHGIRVSSSAVREALAAGDLDRARLLLGRAYSLSGRVMHGDKLGRTLGFPTANVQLKHNRPPLLGIYAVRVHGVDTAGPLDGVASIGFRPTVVAGGKATLEVFLFDYSADLYGRHVRVEFVAKIRDEARYDGLEALKAAIAEDCSAARRLLAERR